MIINCFRLFITRNSRRCHIRKALLIIDISGRSLQSCRAASDMGIQFTDHSCRISFKNHINLRILPGSSMSGRKTVKSSLIITILFRDVCSPAYTSLTSDQTDWILCGFLLNNDLSHLCSLLPVDFLLAYYTPRPFIPCHPSSRYKACSGRFRRIRSYHQDGGTAGK